jgi:hypothetical protein
MYKIKKKAKPVRSPVLYNIIEDYTESDPPGNVTVCAMAGMEDLPEHARVLAESYGIPVDAMASLLSEGGTYVYPSSGPLVTTGMFVCRVDPTGGTPKQTWVLDVAQYAEAEQLRRSYGLSLLDAATRVFRRTLPQELHTRLEQKNLGLDAEELKRAGARGADIAYIDFRKDWSPHFKRLCAMPDGTLAETGGVDEFAALHGITVEQAKTLVADGGILDIGGELLACQVVNGQPSIARFSVKNSTKARSLAAERGMHLMDALSEVALADPVMMRALRQLERNIASDRQR